MQVPARQRVLQQTAQHAATTKPAPLARAEVRQKSANAVVLQLQRTIGNRAVQRLLLQRKIDVTSGEPTLSDPIPLVLGGITNLGRTRPGMNGRVFPDGLTTTAYKEAAFDGDVLRVNGAAVDWRTLSAAGRATLVGALLTKTVEVEELVTIRDYRNLVYNSVNQIRDMDLVTDRLYCYRCIRF